MNASTGKLAVLQAQLPYTDRRALSEAWFSAFHLAASTAEPAAGKARTDRAPAPALSGVAARYHEGEGAAARVATAPERALRRRAGDVPSDAPDRAEAHGRARAARTETAKATGAARTVASHATFTLCVDDARVAIHVRRDGAKLIVIAVCSPRHVEVVQRALATTALAMRERGQRIDTAVHSFAGEAHP